MTTKIDTDIMDFESGEFSPQQAERQPFCQIINPRWNKYGMADFGFAITKANAEASGFDAPPGWKPVLHEFASGDTEEMYMSLQPKIVIIAQTPRYAKSRETGKIIGETRQVDYWGNKHLYKPCSYAWCYVLGENDSPVHPTPLLISLNGASGASFMSGWLQYKTKTTDRSGFCFDMEAVYASMRKQHYKNMGELFHAHCIYEPHIEADERGVKPNTALVAVVNSYKPATPGQLIRNGSELSEMIKVGRESVKDWRPRIGEGSPVEDDGYSPKGKPRDVSSYEDDLYPPY
jgi:Family of unknown function (DUF5895)